MKRITSLLIVVAVSFFSLLAYQDQSFAQSEVQELKKKIESLERRVEQLEASQLNMPLNNSSQGNDRFSRGWDPFVEIERMQAEMNQMFQGSFQSRLGANSGVLNSDVFSEENFQIEDVGDQYVVKIDISGMDKEKIDVDINPHSITISGEYSQEEQMQNSQGAFSSKSFGTYLKTIPLPTDADMSQLKTVQEQNMLIISIPKK